jgi:predicted NUDIX family NTP pyrophosphohydrolase
VHLIDEFNMSKKSAGILLFRFVNKIPEVLLVHPGGPFWKNKDIAAWSVPKGEFENEIPLEAAKREFVEEVGVAVSGKFIELQPSKLKSGKTIYVWAVEGNVDVSQCKSNCFTIEYPPKSGERKSFPEVDKTAWFPLAMAKIKINHAQLNFISQLEQLIV